MTGRVKLQHLSANLPVFGKLCAVFLAVLLRSTSAESFQLLTVQPSERVFALGVQAGFEFPVSGDADLVARAAEALRHRTDEPHGAPISRQTVDARDAVDTQIDNEFGHYTFIDTAGLRRRSKVEDRIEKFSAMRAKAAIERADVCLIMLDAREGVTEQDTKIAGLAHEAGKASIVVVNKWDLVEKDTHTMDRMRREVQRDLSFMPYAPILFISSLTGQRTERIFELVNFVNEQASMRITTGMLNNVLADAQARQQPPTDKGRRLKVYYMTQTGVKPPHFVIFCNSKELFHFSYQRYIENRIRAAFGLEGTPIRMTIRQKGDKE